MPGLGFQLSGEGLGLRIWPWVRVWASEPKSTTFRAQVLEEPENREDHPHVDPQISYFTLTSRQVGLSNGRKLSVSKKSRCTPACFKSPVDSPLLLVTGG